MLEETPLDYSFLCCVLGIILRHSNISRSTVPYWMMFPIVRSARDRLFRLKE